jgi:hypothetical protein
MAWLSNNLSVLPVAGLLALVNASPWSNNVRPAFQLALARSANDLDLSSRLLRLSPLVREDEAQQVTFCAYTTGRELARTWRVSPVPSIQNFLVNTGARKGGLCFQWANELLLRLDKLKLQTLDLHWAESYAGTEAEHNVIVVTAKGQPFEKGIILDNWRYEGHLLWGPVTGDPEYRWTENPGELAHRLKARIHYGLPAG